MLSLRRQVTSQSYFRSVTISTFSVSLLYSHPPNHAFQNANRNLHLRRDQDRLYWRAGLYGMIYLAPAEPYHLWTEHVLRPSATATTTAACPTSRPIKSPSRTSPSCKARRKSTPKLRTSIAYTHRALPLPCSHTDTPTSKSPPTSARPVEPHCTAPAARQTCRTWSASELASWSMSRC